MKKLFSIFLVSCLIIGNLSSVAFAKEKKVKEMPLSKGGIDEVLQEKMEQMEDDEKVEVVIWFKDIKEPAKRGGPTEGTVIVSMTEEEFWASKKKATSGEESIDTMEADLVGPIPDDIQEKINQHNEKMKKERKEKNKIRKAKIKEHNNSIIESLDPDLEITFQSQLAPMIYANLTTAQINELAKNKQVDSISFLVSEEMIDNTSIALSTIGSTEIRNKWNYDGHDITVGQIENSIPNNRLTTIVKNPDEEGDAKTSSHANLVAECINSAAPNAKIYSTTATLTDYIPAAVEALMKTEEIEIINISSGPDGYGNYSQNSRYIDYVSTKYKISVIATSGNNDSSSNDYVNDLGLAYNALTVGGYNDNGTSSNNDDYFDNKAYSYKEDIGEKNVPEVMAPGVNISSYNTSNMNGSSFAAPLVAGSFAQLGNIQFEAANTPYLVKALAAASAYYKLPNDNTWGNDHVEGNEALSDKQGAGKFNAKFAAEILRAGRYRTYEDVDEGFNEVIPVKVTSSDTVLRVAAAWKQHVTVKTGDSAEPLYDFDIYLYDPSGDLVASSNGANSNTELIDYKISSYGTYEIEIKGFNTNGDTTDIAIAWY